MESDDEMRNIEAAWKRALDDTRHARERLSNIVGSKNKFIRSHIENGFTSDEAFSGFESLVDTSVKSCAQALSDLESASEKLKSLVGELEVAKLYIKNTHRRGLLGQPIRVADSDGLKKQLTHVGAEHQWQVCPDCEQTGVAGDDECKLCAGSGWIPG